MRLEYYLSPLAALVLIVLTGCVSTTPRIGQTDTEDRQQIAAARQWTERRTPPGWYHAGDVYSNGQYVGEMMENENGSQVIDYGDGEHTIIEPAQHTNETQQLYVDQPEAK